MATQPILRRANLSEQVFNHLTDLIVDGTFPPGQSLSPERELARQYGVSVGVIREAIRSLAAMGLVEVRHGVGSIVNARESWNTAAPMTLLIQSEPSSVLAVHDVRAPLEIFSAETAAAMAGPADVAQLDTALARMKASLEEKATPGGRLEANISADLDFHVALARATRNRILLSVLQSLIEPIHDCMLRGTIVPSAVGQALTMHREIADAIRSRDAVKARAAMRQHMKITREELEGLARTL